MALLILKILLTLFALQALVKFFVFFFVSYEKRTGQLEKSYAGKMSATTVFDDVILIILLALVVLLFVSKSMQYISFIAGLYIGATLIQVYFHRFSTPLPPEKSPDAPVSPIKLMSYAIQANPEKPWKEIILLALLFGWGLYMLVTQGFGLL